MMLCNHETDYFLETITAATGRRYNSVENPIISRNISRDDVAGFFKTLLTGEEHQWLLQIVNHFQVANTDMIISTMGHKFNQFKSLKETCLLTGLIFENQIKTTERDYFWYMVDTGGIYALDEMGEQYNHLPFTMSLEQKYKQYLKSLFVFNVAGHYDLIGANKVKDGHSGQVYHVVLLEEVKQSAINGYQSTIFLVNLETLTKLNINDELRELARMLTAQDNKIYDLSKKIFLTFVK